MAKGTICDVYKDKIMSLEFIQNMIKNNPSAMGLAMVLSDGKFEVRSFQGALKPQDLFDAQAQFLQRKLYYFADLPKNVLPSDLQPSVLLTDSLGKPVVAGLLEGDFSAFVHMDSSHLDSFNLGEKILKPKLAMLYRLTGYDVDKLFTECASDVLKEDICSLITGHGSIVFAFSNGEVVKYVKSESARETDFGWCSNDYGFSKKAKATATEGSGGMMDMLREKVLSPITTAIAASTVPEAVPDNTILADGWPKNLTVEHVLEKNYKRERPPTDYKRRSKVNDWYRNNVGTTPPNAHQNRPAMFLLKDRKKAEHTFNAILKKRGVPVPGAPDTAIAAAMDKAGVTAEVPKPMSAADRARARQAASKVQESQPEPQKDTTVHNKPTSDIIPKHTPSMVDIESLPVIPPEDKQFIREFLNEYLYDGEAIPDPRDTQALEEKLPNAFEAIGLKGPSQTYRVPWLAFKDLASTHPDFVALLAFSYRNNEIKLLSTISELTQKLGSAAPSQGLSAAERARQRHAARA